MTESPDKIKIDSIEALSDSRVLETIDYIVTAGDVYQLKLEGYSSEQYLKKVDEIPPVYWELWDHE